MHRLLFAVLALSLAACGPGDAQPHPSSRALDVRLENDYAGADALFTVRIRTSAGGEAQTIATDQRVQPGRSVSIRALDSRAGVGHVWLEVDTLSLGQSNTFTLNEPLDDHLHLALRFHLDSARGDFSIGYTWEQ